MKTITFAFVALMISGCAGSRYSSDSDRSMSEHRSLSGSSSNMVPTGNTMNDHDKMLEMCQSMRTTKSCDEILRECQGQSNPQSCMRNYMQ